MGQISVFLCLLLMVNWMFWGLDCWLNKLGNLKSWAPGYVPSALCYFLTFADQLMADSSIIEITVGCYPIRTDTVCLFNLRNYNACCNCQSLIFYLDKLRLFIVFFYCGSGFMIHLWDDDNSFRILVCIYSPVIFKLGWNATSLSVRACVYTHAMGVKEKDQISINHPIRPLLSW